MSLMPEGRVVCNTSPLLYLHQVNQLELLSLLYGQVLIPPAVRAELRRSFPVPFLSWTTISAGESLG